MERLAPRLPPSRVSAFLARRDGRTLLFTLVSFVTAGTTAVLSESTPGTGLLVWLRWAVVAVTTAVGAWGLWRGRLSSGASVVAILSVVATATTSAFTYDTVTMRWVCILGITTLPMLTLFLLERRWSVPVNTATWAGQLAVLASTRPTTTDFVVSAAVLAVCLGAFTAYPAHLLKRSDAARTTAEQARSTAEQAQALAEQARALAEHAATHDVLTGLLNRRGLAARTSDLLASAAAAAGAGWGVAVLLIDVDHFKRVNDTYGHDTGDVVLADLAALLKRSVREGDVCVRLGGEEFAVLLVCDGPGAAVAAAERLRRDASGRGSTEVPSTTISIGVAMVPASAAVDQGAAVTSLLLSAADKALYAAKAAGRDRVVLASEPAPPVPDLAVTMHGR